MVAPYINGRKAEWAEVERVLAAGGSPAARVEVRTDAGVVLGEFVPRPDDPDWVKAITPEAIQEALAGPFYTFDELKQRLGWE